MDKLFIAQFQVFTALFLKVYDPFPCNDGGGLGGGGIYQKIKKFPFLSVGSDRSISDSDKTYTWIKICYN
jgi:hypothetical protein